MPARKTIAAAAAERTRSRQRNVLMVVGAVPIVVLVLLGGLFAYRHFTALGPNELPASISGGDRKDIQQTIQAFFDGVNQYNPQTASETMLPLAEVGKTNMERLALETAALQSETLTFQIQTLGSTTLDEAAMQVAARVATNYGPRDFVLTRRDGQWRVAKAPDLIVPQSAGPVAVSWEITNTFWSDDGNSLSLAGNLKNIGTAPGYVLTVGGFVDDAAGSTLSTNRLPPGGSPFLNPGGQVPFVIALAQPPDTKLDPARVTFVPDVRAVPAGSDIAFNKRLTADPPRLQWKPGQLSYTLTSQEPQDYKVTVFAAFRDASGRLLTVAVAFNGKAAANSSQQLAFAASKLPATITGIATVDLTVIPVSQQ